MTFLRGRRPLTAPKKSSKTSRTATAEKLHQLKRRYQLHSDQAKTYAEDCRAKIETNQENIRKLRIEIAEERASLISAKTNECLMRQALRDHHAGSRIFREREPRDVNENVDYKIGDLKNKLNNLRHEHVVKKKHLGNLLSTLNEAVDDVAYLELEGPMGDNRCLAIENEIGTNDKKCREAEMIGHTYRHIRDKLAVAGLSYQTELDAISKLVQDHKQDLTKYLKSEVEAVRGAQKADTEVYTTELDIASLRKYRRMEITDFKKQTDEEKHEFTALWKTIQAHFAAQESMPLPSMTTYPSRLSLSSSTELHTAHGMFEYSDEELELIKNVTGSHTVPEVAEKYEQQEAKQQYAKALVDELEVKKAALLWRLDELKTEHKSLLYQSDTEHDALLRTAGGDNQPTRRDSFSRLAARSRVTQTLARLRQLLEYLTTEFWQAGLIEQAPELDSTDTEHHLRVLLASAGVGAAALMSSLSGAEPERARRAAAAAAFLMTRSEERVQRRRTQLEGESGRDEISYGGTDGDTTGDDAVPSRAAIKRQANLILMAKQKTGSRRRK